MSKPSEPDQAERLRQKIIGLGERSMSKSYYPELRRRLDELEEQKAQLEEKAQALQKLMDKLEAERRRTAASEANYRSVVENIQDVFYRSDLAGRLIMASPSVLRLLGYETLTDCLGKLIAETFYFNPLDREEMLRELRAHGEIVNYEVVLKRKDGSPVAVETNSHLYRDDEGRVAGIEGTFRDISERKRAEEERRKLEAQLIQAQKMESIGRLAGGIAHDFNNMLTPILGYAEILKEDIPLGDPRHASVVQILQAAERSRDLVRQLLAFARRQALEMKRVDLNQVVQGFERMLRRTLSENIALDIRLTPGQAFIRADVGQVEQVILNLAVNAQDAMPQGGTLCIETGAAPPASGDRTEDGAPSAPGGVLTVRDTGVGMTTDTMEKIFEPFFTTKSEGKGVGLGLATVYGIVKQHGGHIAVASELGHGSVFRVTFPPGREDPVAAELPEAATRTFTGTETVLVVEDQEQVRTLTVGYLRRQGYRVLEANSCRAVREKMASLGEPIHLLITDVILADGNGQDVFRLLSGAGRPPKVLYMSGYTSDVISPHGLQEGGRNYLQKPFSLLSFTQKVRAVLDTP